MEVSTQVMAYIRKTIPDYEHDIKDFTMIKDGYRVRIIDWNPEFEVKEPTEKQLAEITLEEHAESIEKSIRKNPRNRFKSIEERLDALESAK